jgi:1-deoxy-D-xylulose 5-phosphate reductoisomerase
MISIIQVPDMKLSINHAIVYREGRVLSQAAQTFLEFLRNRKPEFASLLL